MALNTSNRVNENERHEKIAVIANDLSKWRWYSHNGKGSAGDFPVTDKYTANITSDGIIKLKDKETGRVLHGFPSSYLDDIATIKDNVPENEKEDAWQKADWYLAEKLLRVIEDFGKAPQAPTRQDLQATLEDDKGGEDEEREPQQKGKKKKPMVTKEILQKILGVSSDFWDLLTDFDINDAFEQTGFDRTKLFGDTTKVNPVSATAKIPSSAKKSPDNSDDKVQPVESSQSNIDINDIIHQIIEKMAPKGKESIDAVKVTCQPMIIEIMIHGDGTVTVKTDAQRTPANSSSSRVELVEGEEPISPKRESQKTKPVSDNFSGIKKAIAGLKKAAAATQETQEPNQELINMVERLAQMNKNIQNAKVDIPTPNHDKAVENERKTLEEIGAIMDSYNTMIEGIPRIIAGIDKKTTGNEEKIANMKIQLEDLEKNIENYIQNLTTKVEEITSKVGAQNLNEITALCGKLQKLAGTFEKATAAVSGTGNKTPETTETNWGKIKAAFKNVFSNVTEGGTKEWNTFTNKLNGLLTKFGETAQTWKEKFTTLLQQFIKGEKDYGTIKGEIEKEENSGIKGLLLAILEEVKNITEQLKTKKETNMNTDTTATPAQNGGKSGGEGSKPQAVVEGQKPNKDNKVENAEENSDKSITKIGECPKGKPSNYETYKIDYPTVGTKYKTPYGWEVSIVKYLKDDNGNWKVVLNKNPIGGTEEEVTDSIESIILFYLQENANNKRKRVNEEKTKNETKKQDETENTNANQQDKMEKQQESNKDSNQQLKQGKPQEKQAIIHALISAEDPQIYDKLLGGLKDKPHKKEENVENPENEGSVSQQRENHEPNNLTDVPVNQGNISSKESNTQGKGNTTPNTSQPAKKPEEKGALSRFSAQVREKIKNAWNWVKGLFIKKDKKNNSPKNATTKGNMKDTRKSEMEYNGKLKLKKGEHYCNKDGEVIFTVSEVNGDNITLIYERGFSKLEMNKTRQEVEKIVKQFGYKKK